DGTMATLQKIPLADWDNGAQAVIQYVKRMHQPVVVDNATTHEQFKMDPYISRTQAKSILCVPLLKHTGLKAILYVENNLMTHAFTPEHVQTVLILTAQMAISLENARYVAEQITLTQQLAEQSVRRQIAEKS
ncbi:GAF domain-containing protein, partial [Rhizobium leguminosarum]|nr:GAF domain-containing protein [Rhizobium leguminosarum]